MNVKFRIFWIVPRIMIEWEDVKEKFNFTILDEEWNTTRLVQMYTGYVDADGQEIYEGDLLECGETYFGDHYQKAQNYEVKWVEGAWMAVPFGEGGYVTLFDAIENMNALIYSNVCYKKGTKCDSIHL